VEQQSFVRPRVQAHIGSKAKLPGARGSPCTGSTRRPRQKPRKVAGEAVGENSGWKIKLIIFVGGKCGSVHAQTLNNNLKELGVIESKRNTVRKGLVHELLNAQDTVLCSYFAQRSGARGEGRGRESTVEEAFQGLDYFE
jgi:hypothetical protein